VVKNTQAHIYAGASLLVAVGCPQLRTAHETAHELLDRPWQGLLCLSPRLAGQGFVLSCKHKYFAVAV
jgi:hypothetical protein